MSKALATKNVAAMLLAVVMVFGFAFAFATPAKADTLSDLQSQIQTLLAQIASLQGGSSSSSMMSSCTAFTRNHMMGNTGGEVMAIQKFLNSHGFPVAASGAGSAGNETSSFGPKTKMAVAAWQASAGIAPAAGYWGPLTRAKANGMCSSMPGVPGVPGVPMTGNGLKVMLASDNPTFGALVQGQATAELARYTFTNPTSASIMVTNMAFKRIGSSVDSTVSNVYLFQGATRLTDPAGISNSSFNFTNNSGIFTLLPGGSVTISVKADIAGSTNGQQVGVQLTGVTASGALDGSVVLPISGSTFSISSASIATGVFGTVTPTGSTFSPATDTTVFQSTLTIGNRAVWLKSIQVENRGSADTPKAFRNLRLLVKGTQVGSAVASSMGDKVVFDLSASPVRLETGGNEIRVVADIISGSGETFDFQVRRAIDAQLIDVDLNQPLVPTGSLSAAAVNNIEGVALSVTKGNTSPTSNVAVDATNVLWGRFEFRATGDNLKIEQITVDTDTTAAAGLDNGKVFFNGVQVGSTQDIAEGGTTVFSLGSQMILTAGATGIVEIYSDAKTAAGGSFTSGQSVDVGVSVATADTEGVDSGDRISSAISEVEGNSITISSSSLTGTKASGYGNQTIVAGTNNAKIGSFTLSTGSTEGVNVNTVVITFPSSVTSTLTDLRLVDNATGVQIGTTKSAVSTSNTFSVNVPMGVSQTKTVNLIANIQSGAGSTTVVPTLGSATGGTGNVTGNSVTTGSGATLQTITIGSGTLTVTRDPGTPVNANVVAGSNMVHIGRFDFAAANSSYTVQEVMVKIPADAATSVSNVTLKYKDAAGVEQTVSQAVTLSSGAQTHATATFTGLTMNVPLNDSADMDVYVDIPTITSGAKSGAAISASLDAGEGFKAIDGAGTQDTSLASTDIGSTDASGYGTKYVKKSIPTLARLSTGYTSNTVSSGVGLYRFTVTADAAGSVEWRQISFTVASSGVVASDYVLYDVTGTAVAINTTAVNLPVNATGLVSICPGTSCTIGESEQIGAGSTKTYELRPTTVSGWGNSGDSITVNFTEDSSAIANAAASGLHAGQKMVWSDRSTNSHTTTTADWTNGYLVKDMDNDTRSCQFGSSTTCTP